MNQDVMVNTTGILPAPTTPEASTRPRRSYRSHGFTSLLRGRSKADARQIDGRSSLGQAMAQYKANLISDLGGQENLSTQELTIVEMVSKDWLILQSIDAYLLQAGLFSRRRKSAYALTIQRGQIADSLTRRLQAVGLKRRAKPVGNLADLLRRPNQPPQSPEGEHQHG